MAPSPTSLAPKGPLGSLLSTTILQSAAKSNNINSRFLDIRNYINTNDNYLEAQINAKKTKNKIINFKRELKKYDILITQGFIASDTKGVTTTLGRGGSDYSASVIGAFLKADEIQIWTDVSGVLSADPRKVKDVHPIPKMTFDEIRELAFYGAKVLHPDTIKPAIEEKIPVRILNTFKPKDKGTLIVDSVKSSYSGIRSVITKTNYMV